MRIDLHNHTDHSPDGVLSPLRLLLLARARGLDCIAVTDHNRLEGALRCAELAQGDASLPRVIPGAEVRSLHGEIVGLFLERNVPAGRSALQTIDLIRAQGGIVYLPHPYDVLRRATVSPDRVEEVARHVDVIEVANGRALLARANDRALALAARCGARLGAGSDAHFAGEVGRCYLEVPDDPTLGAVPGAVCSRDGFLRLLARARPHSLSPAWALVTAWTFALRTGALKAARGLTSRL